MLILATTIAGTSCQADNATKIIPVINSLLLDDTSTEVPNTGNSWGAKSLGDLLRPDRSWLSSFDGAQRVVVSESIVSALSSCLPNAYCVLEINQLVLTETLYFNRPRTKFEGVEGNKITYSATTNTEAFFQLETGANEVIFENLHLDGESTSYGENPVYGIIVSGHSINKVAMLGNHIHHLHSDNDAHGIAVYGSGATESTAIQNIIIDSNNIHDMRTGSSESIAINGNVKHWEITNNQVSHVNNIAIDAIGGEGTSPVQTINGRVLPSLLDAARFGFIEDNVVTDMSTETNPAYGSVHTWAGGIYVDGGRDIIITDNTVIGSEWAYDVGAENCVVTSHIRLENNTATNSYFGDFYTGGYADNGYKTHPEIECDPSQSIDDNEGHGNVENITVISNTFSSSSAPINPLEFVNTIEFGNRILQSVITHEGVGAQHPDGIVTGNENSIRTTE